MFDTRMYEEGNEFMIEKELHMNSFRHTSGLFQLGDFTLSSGKKSNFLIDCDKLTDDDLYTLAYRVSEKIPFRKVIPVLNGGARFATQLEKFVCTFNQILVVEDVITTGRSIERVVRETQSTYPDTPIRGVALFNRSVSYTATIPTHPIFAITPLFS